MIETKKIDYRLQPIDVFSENNKFIKTSFREAIKTLFKKKIIVACSYNPLIVKFNCEHKDYINKAEQEALKSIKNKDEKIKKYLKEYNAKIKESGRKIAPVKRGIKRNKEQEERIRNFFNYPSKKDSLKLYNKLNKNKIKDDYILRKNSGSLKKEQILEIGEKQKWSCFYCTKDVSNKYSKDHYFPIKLGGLTTKKNIVICCRNCNVIKGKKTPLEFYKYVLLYGIHGYIYENCLFFDKIKKEIKNQKENDNTI
jgi:5-methylcytosine-specific restriction endonuclease McrA